MSDVLVIGGGPSLDLTYWRHRLTAMPSIAINHHAYERAGIITDYYVQIDPPRMGEFPPVAVLESEKCAKYLVRRSEDPPELDKYPNVHHIEMDKEFDWFHEFTVSDRGAVVPEVHRPNTFCLCIRLLCCLKLRDLYFIGCDLTGWKHDYHRNFVKATAGPLNEHWGMTFHTFEKENVVDEFISVAA